MTVSLVTLPAEGFQSWMWRGLTFLLPFLFFGHVSHIHVPVPCSGSRLEQGPGPLRESLLSPQFWQLFNALTLFNLARDPECKEWQVSQAGRAVGTWPDPLCLAVHNPGSPQVLMCGFPFLLLFLGNFFTTLRVVHQKFHSQRHRGKKE